MHSQKHVSFSQIVCRLLERQLQTQGESHEKEAESMRAELQRLRAELDQQQQMLSDSLELPQDARIQASLQHEISRLTQQNMVGAYIHTRYLFNADKMLF